MVPATIADTGAFLYKVAHTVSLFEVHSEVSCGSEGWRCSSYATSVPLVCHWYAMSIGGEGYATIMA